MTEDIVKFQVFVKEKVVNLTQQVNERKDAQSFFYLVKATLARIVTFNKRRWGEVAKIMVTDYTERQKGSSQNNQDVYAMLTKTEQKLASR